MSLCWKQYKKGAPLPPDAFKAGRFHKDGDLYVGLASNGEVGKLNVDGKAMHNLWCHNSSCHTSGKILCGTGVWKDYAKGETLPSDAFKASEYCSADETELYVGLTSNGEVGKLNVEFEKMFHLWCHHSGKSTSGKILCAAEAKPEVVVGLEFSGKPEIISVQPKVANEDKIINKGDADITVMFAYEESKSYQKGVSVTGGFKFTAKQEATASTGILPGGSVKTEIGFELSFSVTGEFSVTDQAQTKKSVKVVVKPGKSVHVSATLYEVKCRIPFTMQFESGKTTTGTWEGQIQSRAEYRTENI